MWSSTHCVFFAHVQHDPTHQAILAIQPRRTPPTLGVSGQRKPPSTCGKKRRMALRRSTILSEGHSHSRNAESRLLMDTTNTKAPQEGATFSKFSERNFTTAAHRKNQPEAFMDGWNKVRDESERNPWPHGSDQFLAWNCGYNLRPF